MLDTSGPSDTQATIKLNLDAADSPTDQYRIEFFANTVADPSGYGEGQIYLGSSVLSNGDNQQTTITLPTGTDLTGKSISATTTAIDSTTESGFRGTSEFGQIVVASVSTSDSDGLAGTGESRVALIVIAVTLLTVTGLVTIRQSLHRSVRF